MPVLRNAARAGRTARRDRLGKTVASRSVRRGIDDDHVLGDIYVDSATTEDGLRVVVNADTVPRTLVVYTGTFCTKLRLAATLQLSGTGTRTGTDSAWDNPVPAGEYGYYVVQFQAGASGRTLTIDLVIDQNYCPTGDLGEVWLGGAALY